jgi:hypothetical protein
VSVYRGRYYSATRCDSSPKPGTNALVSWFLGAYASRGAANLGTYACKRLGSGWSIHAERRAADLGTAPYGGVDSTWGWELANALRLNSAELGIQCIILGRRIWSCSYPDAGWRSYPGQYHGHAHVELIPSAARNLTAATIQSLIGGSGGPTTQGGIMLPRKGDGLDASGKPLPSSHPVRESVRYWQRRLVRLGFDTIKPGDPESWRYDGIYGDGMQRAVAASRKAYGTEDHNVERITGWHAERMDYEVARLNGPAAQIPDSVIKAAAQAAVSDVLGRVRLTVPK